MSWRYNQPGSCLAVTGNDRILLKRQEIFSQQNHHDFFSYQFLQIRADHPLYSSGWLPFLMQLGTSGTSGTLFSGILCLNFSVSWLIKSSRFPKEKKRSELQSPYLPNLKIICAPALQKFLKSRATHHSPAPYRSDLARTLSLTL